VSVLIFSVVVHEVAHGYVALRLGDTTARDQGRLTLNPLRHIDPIGSIVVPLMLSLAGGVLLAWARPVPVRVEALRDPLNDHPKVAAAGPASNLLLAAISAVLGGLIVGWFGVPRPVDTDPTAYGYVVMVFQLGIVANVWLAVFNLLPLPPLDGSWIAARAMPPALRHRYLGLGRYGFLVLLGFILLMKRTGIGDVFVGAVSDVMAPFFLLFQAMARLVA
jgi:Zn-dependent protease